MPAITIRNLPATIHRALQAQAARHGRSTEAEVRAILEAATQDRVKLGAQLTAIGEEVGGVDLDIRRDRQSIEPAAFE